MNLSVFKFGGASVKDASGIKNIGKILELHKGQRVAVVISAMGKSTNALEKITDAFFYKKPELAAYVSEIKNFHKSICSQLFESPTHPIYSNLEADFNEMEDILAQEPTDNWDFEYDQIVSYGEFWATKIVSNYLNEIGVSNTWIDIIDMLKTDNTYREAKVDWETTQKLIRKFMFPIFEKSDDNKHNLVITQGFTGQTDGGWATTLGREGSDYTAAILAFCLDAKDVTIWKDVPGVLNADPKWFSDTVKLDKISYLDAIELAYYGASVIHPKTIQPLQNKSIPLYVKSFVNPDEPGTVINADECRLEVPSFIFKINQVLITISTRDFSFIIEENLRDIFQLFTDHRVRMNVMQNSALNLTVSVDYNERTVNKLIKALDKEYKVRFNKGLELVTIRNYDQATIDRVCIDKEILFEQKSRTTVQLVVKQKE
ncbi:MAG: aspartate kinase [Bacteroidota bacterium]